MKQRAFTVDLIWRGTTELQNIYESGEEINQKEAVTKNITGEPVQTGLEGSS